MQCFEAISKTTRMISVLFQGKPFNITVTQVYAPTTNVEEAEAEWFYEDLQDLLKLTCKKYILFMIEDWNAKVGSQKIPGVTDKFGLGVQNEARQRLTEFCQQNTLVIANTLFQQHKRRLWRTVWLKNQKLSIEFLYDPAIPLSGILFRYTRKN